MYDSTEKKRLAILKILQENQRPTGSKSIRTRMADLGYDMPDRTVRFHLLYLDKMGLTVYHPKKGRSITNEGVAELSKARIIERVGFLAAKIDRMMYRMSFDISKCEGNVVINLSLIKRKDLESAFELIEKVFDADFGMGKLLILFRENEQVEDTTIPEGYVGIGTVCSITINGILLAHGIPTRSRFGGVLELERNVPTRFSAIINYDGTTLDPLEIFIRSKMLNLSGIVADGEGSIGASFREMPEESRERVVEVSERLESIGLGGFLKIGYPGQSLCEIPVSEGTFGSLIKGGLNPVAILDESGIEAHSTALSSFIDIKRMTPYTDFRSTINKYL